MNIKTLALPLVALAVAMASNTTATAQQRPMMGWSSWNTFALDINPDIICAQADAMARLGLQDAGYTYINVDDGFFGYRDSTGLMHPHPTRFPGGMKPVSDHIHRLGLKAGIYSDAGHNTCGSMGGDRNGIGAGLWGHVAQDARLYFNDWGFDFIKIDYCGGNMYGLDEQAAYTAIADTIAQVANHPVCINVCRWAYPGAWVRRIAGSWRMSGDIADSWPSVRDIIARNLFLSAYASPGHFNDMDMLEIGRSLTHDEEVTHFGMWCMMCSPLLIGCDLTKIPDQSLQLLKNRELIALDQDPLGLQAYMTERQGEGCVLVKDIEKAYSTTRAVALYNPGDTACHFAVSPESLCLAGKVRCRDLVLGKDLPTLSAGQLLCADVPAHGTVILRLQADKRLEQTVYEAENAFLPTFQDMGDVWGPNFYDRDDASCRQVVSGAGGHPDTVIVWPNVHSFGGGDYQLTVKYFRGLNRFLTVSVNGDKTHFSDFANGHKPGQITLRVRLRPGDNTITLGSLIHYLPDIDCISLTKII